MKRKKMLIGFLSLFLLVGFLSSLTYAGGGKCSKKGKSSLSEKLFSKALLLIKSQEELGLSDEQVDKLKALKIEAKKEIIKKKAEIDVLAVDIKAGLWQPTIDTKALDKLIDQKYELKKAKAKYIINMYANVKNVLNDDQKAKLKSLYAKKCSKCK